jgi:hypothetical protein
MEGTTRKLFLRFHEMRKAFPATRVTKRTRVSVEAHLRKEMNRLESEILEDLSTVSVGSPDIDISYCLAHY